MSVNKKFFVYFFSIFIFLMGLIALFQYQQERQYRADQIDIQLISCNELIDNYIRNINPAIDNMDELALLLSDTQLRITVIDTTGKVLYDSFLPEEAHMELHNTRPEIKDLKNIGDIGKDIRKSATTNMQYYYLAMRFEDYFIRSALPYNNDLRRMLSANRSSFYLLSGVLLFAMFGLFLIAMRFSKAVAANETRLKRQLTQNISHELKTPVSSIMGYMESILNNPNIDNDRQRMFVERSYQQSKRLESLLQDISILNQLEEAGHLYERQSCDLVEIINNVIEDVHLQIEQKQAKIYCDLPEHMSIEGNRSLLYSIFRNLIDNALAYSGDHPEVRIICYSSESLYYHITLSDNGPGVAEEHLTHLFERFYRVDRGRSRKLGGTGLGLSIVKNAIRYHRGSINVRNASGLYFSIMLRKR